jgi:hypothetical protein
MNDERRIKILDHGKAQVELEFWSLENGEEKIDLTSTCSCTHVAYSEIQRTDLVEILKKIIKEASIDIDELITPNRT